MNSIEMINLVLPDSAQKFIGDPEIKILCIFCKELSPDTPASGYFSFKVREAWAILPVLQSFSFSVVSTYFGVQNRDIIIWLRCIIKPLSIANFCLQALIIPTKIYWPEITNFLHSTLEDHKNFFDSMFSLVHWHRDSAKCHSIHLQVFNWFL